MEMSLTSYCLGKYRKSIIVKGNDLEMDHIQTLQTNFAVYLLVSNEIFSYNK